MVILTLMVLSYELMSAKVLGHVSKVCLHCFRYHLISTSAVFIMSLSVVTDDRLYVLL